MSLGSHPYFCVGIILSCARLGHSFLGSFSYMRPTFYFLQIFCYLFLYSIDSLLWYFIIPLYKLFIWLFTELKKAFKCCFVTSKKNSLEAYSSYMHYSWKEDIRLNTKFIHTSNENSYRAPWLMSFKSDNMPWFFSIHISLNGCNFLSRIFFLYFSSKISLLYCLQWTIPCIQFDITVRKTYTINKKKLDLESDTMTGFKR